MRFKGIDIPGGYMNTAIMIPGSKVLVLLFIIYQVESGIASNLFMVLS